LTIKRGRIQATNRNNEKDHISERTNKNRSGMVARTAREILRWLEGLYLTYPVVVPKW